MLELYLIRHGETDRNRQGAYLGWTDVELNETGWRQAEALRKKLRAVKADAIFSSPLRRALDTATIINRDRDLEIRPAAALKERNFGIWEDLTFAEIQTKYPVQCQTWLNDPDYATTGAERPSQVQGRVDEFLRNLLESSRQGCYIMVSHAGCIRMMLTVLLGLPPEAAWRFAINHCGITQVRINAEGYASLIRLNG